MSNGTDDAGRGRDSRSDRQVSLLAEAIAGVGAVLVLTGSATVIAIRWLQFGSLGHFGIMLFAASCFLIAGFIVRWFTESPGGALNEALWLVSTACMAGAAAFAVIGIFQVSAAVATLVIGGTIGVCGALFWLACRRELLVAFACAGVAAMICGGILIVTGPAAPWLAVALGVWLCGLAWTGLGWLYPEPLGTSIPLATLFALLGPVIAQPEVGWVYAIGIATAVAAILASIPLRNIVVQVFGSGALVGYITATIWRYSRGSLGIAETLVIIGALLIGLGIAKIWLARAIRRANATPAHAAKPVPPGATAGELTHARSENGTGHQCAIHEQSHARLSG